MPFLRLRDVRLSGETREFTTVEVRIGRDPLLPADARAELGLQ